ncbi:monooxygenase [Zopfia rhizophila CBS 207.26]|uniref:L-ornithine N(5)-monooxygenase [NAD(P)H] n=1 Tax=Zopfia rhizophila CBS 207.26 TaxID=1314779 RepID=A0A6A6DI16_9PEZI|nr:monooxygenase [Zopfia rhizophila CBS 207.26]
MDPTKEDAIYNERFVRVICIGAGASGICLAYKLKRSFTNFSLTIYDRNPEIGGTWYENRYPGCACDVPSHNYTYSFDPKPDYSSVYAGSKEIRSYFEDFVSKHDLRQFIHTSHLVTRAVWVEEKGEWTVEAKSLVTGQTVKSVCDILIHATGYLNKPAWPRVSGLGDFRGVKLHSADYDDRVDLKDRNVLIIGGGSSAVQILPAIQPIVRRAKIIVPTPSWMLPDISTETSTFTPDQIKEFVKKPELLMALPVYMKNTALQNQAKALLESATREILKEYDMVDKLIPDFSVGCKRVIPSGFQFLRTLQEENVSVIHSAASSFTSSGCITEDGQHHEADVMICATGFDTSYIPRYPKPSIMGYMGVGISGFPNTFTLLGPYTPVSSGPTLVAVEAQSDYICSFIDRYQTEPVHSMTVRPSICKEFKENVAKVMEKLVWTDNCRNVHNNGRIGSRVPTTWPGSTLHYLEAIREPRWDDWDFQYRGNRFTWMGNGISQTEMVSTTDLAYYIRQQDNSPLLSRNARNLAMAKMGSQSARELHRQAKLSPAKTNKTTNEETINNPRLEATNRD